MGSSVSDSPATSPRTELAAIFAAANVNEQLAANGWAWHYKQYSSDAKLAQLEASAKAGGKGLWADPNPLPPWAFSQSPAIRNTTPRNFREPIISRFDRGNGLLAEYQLERPPQLSLPALQEYQQRPSLRTE